MRAAAARQIRSRVPAALPRIAVAGRAFVPVRAGRGPRDGRASPTGPISGGATLLVPVLTVSIAGLLLAMPLGVAAAQAYKCTAADGAISFQDRPCAAQARQQRLQLPDDPPLPSVAAPAVAAAPPPMQPIPSVVPVTPREPPPDVFLCVRYDGSRYLSDSGVGDRYAVPHGVLGDAGRGLARSDGGRDGIGVSAPGLRPIPTLPAAEAPFAAAYVQVQDACHRAAPQEACAYMRQQLGDVSDKLQRAFSDTRADLERQQQVWRERMRGC